MCPACDDESSAAVFTGSDWILRTTAEQFRIVECSRCGLLRLDPNHRGGRSRGHDDRIPRQNPSPGLRDAWTGIARRALAMWELHSIRPKARYAGPMLYVSDRDAEHVRILRGRRINVVYTGLESLSQREPGRMRTEPQALSVLAAMRPRAGAYSTIIALDVLQRASSPRPLMAALGDELADGGTLLLRVPNADCWAALILGQRWNGFDIPRHRVMFCRETLQSLLETCGLRAFRWRTFWSGHDAKGLATSLWPGLDPAVRRQRGLVESRFTALLKSALYAMLVLVALPLILLEAASGSGATLTVEATRAEPAPPPEQRRAD